MSLDRRAFLGIAGLSALVVAGRSSLGALAGAGASAGRLPLTRWAMIIDPRQCLKAEGCTDCIAACDAAHNVPHLPEPAH
ncbi:MAG TPA: hypothetical protein VEU07_04115, partial [Candidatus Acidoferrum sp.]|nr:hypothetical protein [Candidatus Acidoferrum sp.]